MKSYPHLEKDKSEVFEYLISQGADINAKDKEGNSPIFYTCFVHNNYYRDKLLQLNCELDVLNEAGTTPLITIVKERNLKVVERLIEHGAKINFHDSKNRNVLHWAVNNATQGSDASNELENFLLSSGADPTALDINKRVPLHYAFVKIGKPFINSSTDPIETVSNILSREAARKSINVQDNWGNTPLHYASQRNAVTSSFYLIKKGAKLETKNNHHNTPLYVALLNNHMNMAISLLQRDASIKDKVTVYTKSILQEMLRKKLKKEKLKKEKEEKEEKKRKRLAAKANGGMDIEGEEEDNESEIESESEESIIESDSEIEDDEHYKNNNKNTNNSWNRNSYSFRRKKQRFGFNNYDSDEESSEEEEEDEPDTCDLGKAGDSISPFMIAIKRNWQGLSFLILESGFDLSLAVLDCFKAGKLNYVYTLLLKKEEGGFYQMKNQDGQNIAHLFSKYSTNLQKNNLDLYTKIYNTIVKKGISFKEVDTFGKTALHYASESGNMTLVKDLLEQGLDINAEDKKKETPFSLLIKNSYNYLDEFIPLAVKHNFNINQLFSYKSMKHRLSTFIVAEKSRSNIIKHLTLFKNNGGDLNLRDSRGYTALMILIRENMEKEAIQVYEELKPSLTVVDNNGKDIMHHIVSPMKYGYYQNTELLYFFAGVGAPLDTVDKAGHTPMYYACLQKTGVMKEALLDNGADEEEIQENQFERVTSSILNQYPFPVTKYDFEEDYKKFNEYVEEEEKRNEDLVHKNEKEQPHRLVQGGKYEVIYEDNEPFSIFMVKVEISRGYYSGNTFYRMQLLKDKIRGVIVLFTNWGRNGTDGQYQHTPFGTFEEGKAEFCKIFKSKSGNKWEDRANFQKKKRKYRLITYKRKNKAKSYLKKINYKDPKLVPSKLNSTIFKFMRRIANSKILNSKYLDNFDFDEEVLPYHSLTKDRLEKAFDILQQIKEIQDTIQNKRSHGLKFDPESADLLTDLTNEFYELIPTTKYRTTSIPPISSQWELATNMKAIIDLMYSEVVIRLLCGAQLRIREVHPVDYCFNSLSFKIVHVGKAEEEYQLIR